MMNNSAIIACYVIKDKSIVSLSHMVRLIIRLLFGFVSKIPQKFRFVVVVGTAPLGNQLLRPKTFTQRESRNPEISSPHPLVDLFIKNFEIQLTAFLCFTATFLLRAR